MTLIQGIILGVIQGLTEFLPVSSTGHLVLAQTFFMIKEPPVILDSILHFGTLLAVIIFFRGELWLIAKALVNWSSGDENNRLYRRLAGYLAIGSIPAAVIGIAFKKLFEQAFKSVPVVGAMLLLTGVLLWLAESIKIERPRDIAKIGISDGIWVGLAQSLSIMPGLSRSGTTITAGLWRGLDRSAAARFSFLLSIPAVLGASSLSFYEAWGKDDIHLSLILFSAAVAFISGFAAIAVLLYLLQQRRLRIFSGYCFVVGTSALVVYFL